ncbi:VOC family protein [Aeromicrobium ginsengisoli]|uniref:VOC family protein n=1 Tax=Aeromicrobium ginsengisoli TaxID=363867 RepID=A0A5M4FIB9_9ACTN|nr:VOC family protein [Aeromicrobium ginsengisoli]KAA1399926.1 VOC family protein [Aeromicrobium ginsengisoli]
MAKEIQVTFDCADPGALAEFWAAALGYQVQGPPPGFATWPDALTAWGVPEDQWNSKSAIVDPDGKGSRIFFQRVPEGKTVKNRVHLDVRSAPGLEGDERLAALEAEAARLAPLGATKVEVREDMQSIFIVMQDPEGNEFCLD